MKRSVLVVLALMLCASMAFAQDGSIMVFSDPGASSCNFTDTGSLVSVYVWHMYTPGATASEWLLDVAGTGWTHLGDTADFDLVIGTSISGVSVSYEVCKVGNFQLMTVNFFGTAAPACTYFGITDVQAVDCASNFVFPTGGEGIVNPDGSCQCDVPVEDTTWGGIKALYQ